MTNKPFTLNKKRLTLMTASAALVLSLATPMALAANDDAPMDDGDEEIVPFDPEDPTAGLDDPLPEDEDEPIDDSDEPIVNPDPEPEEPVVEPEPDPETPIEEPAPEPDPEVGEDTGTEPEPTPVPEVEPDPEVEPETPVVDSGDMNPDSPVRVIVQFLDEAGNEIAPPVSLKGDVGMSYRALNVAVDGYELTGPPTGNEYGVFTDAQATVTYTYANLSAPAPTPAPDDENLPPVVTPENPEEDDTTAPETPVVEEDDEMDDSDEDLVPITPPGEEDDTTTPVDEDGLGSDEDAVMEDGDEVIVDADGNELDGQDKEATDDKTDEKEDKVAPIAAIDDKTGGNGKTKSGELKAIPQASAETNWFMVAMGVMATAGAGVLLYMRRLKPGASQE